MTENIGNAATYEVLFTDLNSEGDGVGRLADGRVVMVEGTLPGDRATVGLISTANSKIARGEAIDLLSASVNRKEHLCPHYAEGCPASPLGVLKYKAALEWKVNHLKETLRRVGGVSVEPEECIASPSGWRYRDRVELAVGMEEGVWKIGYRKELGIAPIHNCLLADDRIGQCIKTLSAALTKTSANQKSEDPGGAVVRLRVGDIGRVVGTLYIASLQPGVKFWGEWLRQGNLAGWEIRKVDSMESRHGDSKILVAEGVRSVTVHAGDAQVTLPAGAFTQANQSLRKKLAEEALRRIPVAGRLLDLYSGYGAFSYEYVRSGGSSLAIDSDRSSIEAGRKAVDGRRIEFVIGNLNNSQAISAIKGTFDAALVDPPYGGLSKAVLSWLQAKGPRQLVYLSCHPAALARDLKGLAKYVIESVQPVDMFPQTPDLETIVRMKRG